MKKALAIAISLLVLTGAEAQQPKNGGALYLLELDGSPAAWLTSLEVEGPRGRVSERSLSGVPVTTQKEIETVSHGEIRFETNLSQSGKELSGWIRETLEGRSTRRSGRLYVLEAGGATAYAWEFDQALITGVSIPARDGSSKDPCYMSITVAPELLRLARSSLAAVEPPTPVAAQKLWSPSNFVLEIGGMEGSRVSKVESFAWEMSVVEAAEESLPLRLEPDRIRVPDLKIEIEASEVEPWARWYEDFVLNGNHGPEMEQTGSLIFLSPDFKTELGRVDLRRVGIFALGQTSQGANRESPASFVAELYVEEMSLQVTNREDPSSRSP